MKTIKATHIDTGGHGYLSVSKKDFLNVLGIHQVTGCSGHNLTRMYLEEDQDASLFMDTADAQGIKVQVKSGYNLKFKTTHNYKPELFSFEPKIGMSVQLHDGMWYDIKGDTGTKVNVSNMFNRYGIPKATIFDYIKAVKQTVPQI